MPQFDGTGPAGEGSMTGRGMGSCGGGQRQGRRNGYGRRGRFGRMMRPFWRQPSEASDKDRIEHLQNEAESIKTELKTVESELARLNK